MEEKVSSDSSGSLIPCPMSLRYRGLVASLSLPRVSACLVSWKRPQNIGPIVRHLRTFPFIDDIVIWNNDPHAQISVEDRDVRVIMSPCNVMTYGRYLATFHARRDIIYTQDDDCLVPDIDKLFALFHCDPTRIVHGLRMDHLQHYRDNHYDGAQMSFVGWGAFFLREWIAVFRSYIDVFGQDRLLWREADRIFSLLLRRRHCALTMNLETLPGSRAAEALWRQPEHRDLAEEAVKRCLSLITAPCPTNVPLCWQYLSRGYALQNSSAPSAGSRNGIGA